MQVESALLFESPAEMYARVFRALKPRTPAPEIRVEYCRFADASSLVRLEGNHLHVKISDLLEGAPAPVLEALAHILLSKLFRRQAPRVYHHRYRLYMNRRDVRRSVHLVRQIRGRKQLGGPRGEAYDLEEVFEELNLRHFHGLLARPALSWSQRPSRTMLGHYDPSHNAIIISRLLDSREVPRLATEYVLYHEMLHLRFPVEHRGARRSVHPEEFRRAEKEFPRLADAKRILKQLAA
ncbi:MAG TPA: SprT-like domain-containing protein [Bryobacteraceae bacterium]|nr:SprT-like domain-containing protein [Bryobacteraceae bacterium]